MSKPIEDYGLIGDGNTAALVSRDGSIDWLCWPRFDSPACLAALLGDERQGYWRISPVTVPSRQSRRYRPGTLILEQQFEAGAGTVELSDFMPMESHTIVRSLRGLSGNTPMQMKLAIRLEYGAVQGWIEREKEGAFVELGPYRLSLHTGVPLVIDDGTIGAIFNVSAGEKIDFVLRLGRSGCWPPPQIDCAEALRTTHDEWQDWLGRFRKDTFWPEAVRRSLLTLKALVYRPTGGIVAAPTTSLPEQPGGELNWDYRYCWLRDATFTLCALLNSGFREEAEAWLAWLVRAIGSDPTELLTMYRVDGSRIIQEYQLDHLPGYRHARPVRIGNAASLQRQLDVFGELLDAFNIAKRAGIPRSLRLCTVERAIAEYLAENWRLPGQGLWESRDQPRQYVYSKVMCWVGIDRYIRNVGDDLDERSCRKFTTLRDIIHRDICAEGYHQGTGTFVDFYGGQTISASLLMLPLVGFLPIEDDRITATIARIERELLRKGLVYRYQGRQDHEEGSFIACNFWLVDCWRMQGRHQEARTLFERVSALANDLGLLSEEYNVKNLELAGNFPQALSHLSLINSALGFSGSVLQRAGG